VTASINGTSGAVNVTSPPGPATHLVVSAPANVGPGSVFSVTVTAKDAANVTATGYAGTVHFTSSDGAAVLPANATLTNGVGTFPVRLFTAGSQTVTATDTVAASINGTSGTILVVPQTKSSSWSRLLEWTPSAPSWHWANRRSVARR
jgi:hypothetical protein